MVKVEIFDEEHEKDLQKRINDFIKGIDEEDLIDIKYQMNDKCRFNLSDRKYIFKLK